MWRYWASFPLICFRSIHILDNDGSIVCCVWPVHLPATKRRTFKCNITPCLFSRYQLTFAKVYGALKVVQCFSSGTPCTLINKQVRQQDAYPAKPAELQVCAILRPLFQGMTTSPSPIVRLYPAYSKLLKLTATSNAGGRSLVRRHVWYHLDRSVQFIYTSLFTRWQQQQIKAKTKTRAHQWILFVTDSAAKRLNKKLSCRRETASPRDASCYWIFH